MRNLFAVVAVACAVAAVCGGPALSARTGKDPGQGDFAIYVAPNQIVVSVVSSVTIHTEVQYSTVEAASATVNGTPVDVPYTFPDDRGNIVAKLDVGQVKEVVSGADSATVELTLVTETGERSAWQTVGVKN
ncbi:MAG TPA: hypothetical protein VM238_17125 [Phycisphaerae bacterium]|nr:hypothetical protein [Phycisphaerae bacterium]